MNADKRPRSSTSFTSDDVILISDDDEPPRKRQKSETPVSDGLTRKLAKPIPNSHVISIASTPEPNDYHRSSDTQATPTAKKPSPWRNRPSWSKPASTSPDPADATGILDSFMKTKPQYKQPESSTQSKFDLWTNKDNHQFRKLTLTRPNPASAESKADRAERLPKYLSSTSKYDNVEQEREDIVNRFKFGSVTALKFNPNTTTTSPGTTNSQDQLPSKFHNKPSQSERYSSSLSQSRPITSNFLASVQIPSSGAPINRANPPPISAPFQYSHQSSSTLTTKQPELSSPNPIRFSVNVPLSNATIYKRERKALQERLKVDIDYAKHNTEEIEKILGVTGFSNKFPNDLDLEKFKKAAQPKKRSVNRHDAPLDGNTSATILSTQPIRESKLMSPLTHPSEQAKSILTARFSEQFEAPLTFTNDVSDRSLNGKFQFVSSYILRKGVKVTGAIGQPGCNCMGPCSHSCGCIRKSFKGDRNKSERFEQVEQYERRPDGLVVLRDDFIKRHMIYGSSDDLGDDEQRVARERVEISECNQHCPCDSSCINRVVQNGRIVPLDIFETQRCGFGVRSPSHIVRGQFIELYLGEVITDNELRQREEAAEAGSTSYIYSLDWFTAQQTYHIDGENFGSAMRFVNHSCDPNAATFPVLNNKSTRQLHLVAFFAIKDIPAGTEITIDYQPHAAGTVYDRNAASEGMEQCRCGASECRQMLWLPRKERKARKKLVGKSFE